MLFNVIFDVLRGCFGVFFKWLRGYISGSVVVLVFKGSLVGLESKASDS